VQLFKHCAVVLFTQSTQIPHKQSVFIKHREEESRNKRKEWVKQ